LAADLLALVPQSACGLSDLDPRIRASRNRPLVAPCGLVAAAWPRAGQQGCRSGRAPANSHRQGYARHTAAKLPQQDSLLQVVIPPNDNSPWRFHIALSQREAGVIGLVVVQWAFLEFALYEWTKKTARRYGLPIPSDATPNVSFNKRLRAFRQLIEDVITNRKRKEKLLTLCSRIAKAAGDRQKVAHGLWSYSPQKPDRLWAEQTKRRFGTRGKTRQIWYHPYTVPRLGKISEEIGTLSFELWYGRGSRDVRFSQSYISRSFLLATQDKSDDIDGS
jgi:hypothetical protein